MREQLQQPLNFDAPRHPRARRTDQRSSHEAAAAIEASGTAAHQARLCLEAVLQHPGCTTRELHHYAGLDIHMAGRRLGELAAEGKIRRRDSDYNPPPNPCRFGNRVATRWYPTGEFT